MSNKKISQLSPAAPLAGTEPVPIVQSGATLRTTTQAIANLATTTPTSSLLVTASAANNVITFTKGNGNTFNVTVNTGSATTTPTSSLLVTASAANNVITFTKGNGNTFNVTVATGSTAPGGSNTTLQYKSGSAFAGSNNLTYDFVNSILVLSGSQTISGSGTVNELVIRKSPSINGTIRTSDLTANRIYQLPDESGSLQIRKYKSYNAELSNTVDVAGVIVFINEIGNGSADGTNDIQWTLTNDIWTGSMTAGNAFPTNKTYISATSTISSTGGTINDTIFFTSTVDVNQDNIYIFPRKMSDGSIYTGEPSGLWSYATNIEIKTSTV
jgi:hypothetical protein